MNPVARALAGDAGRTRSRFFRCALAVEILLAILCVVPVWNAVRVGMRKQVPAFQASERAGGWFIASVDRENGDTKLLRVGDRIVSLDGDPRAALAGPDWSLRALPPGALYTVAVERGGTAVEVYLTNRIAGDSEGLGVFAVSMLFFAVLWSTSLILAYQKPDDPTARRAFVAQALGAAFGLFLAMVPSTGMLYGPWWTAAFLLYTVRPLHLVYMLRFFARFPAEVPVSRFWSATVRSLTAAGFALSVPNGAYRVLQAVGGDAALGFAAANRPLIHAQDTLLNPLINLLSALCFAGTILVVVRNYRALAGADARRRIRWVGWGMAAAAAPQVAVASAWGIAQALGKVRGVGDFAPALNAANAFAVIAPISATYAIVKHRVMGVRVFIRLGIQYLLAKNMLRLLAALPIVSWIVIFALHPDRTVGQLLFEGSAKTNVALLAAALLSLRFREPISLALDRRFFRESYDREQVFLRQIERFQRFDSIPEISRALSDEIAATLHARWISVMYRDDHRGSLSLAYSSLGSGSERRHFPALSEVLLLLEETRRAHSWHDLVKRLPHSDLSVEEPAELLVPIFSSEQKLIGLLLLGEKKSEEPYTAKDRSLLEALAAQIGVVYENLGLRERVRREKLTQRDVLARLEPDRMNLVKECPVCGTCYDSALTVCGRDGAELDLTLPVERVVDRKYRLDRVIGKGGMGAVYEAHDLRLNRTVAVKVMTGALFGNSRALRRFAREARASARLDHPHIVRLYDYGELSGDGAYLVLEYVKGVSLRHELRERRRLPPAEAGPLLEGVFSAVSAAHDAHVLHRDLKPENILITASVTGPAGGTRIAKILDFGLAKVRELDLADTRTLTAAGVALGTAGYMSPEQFAGEEVDERTDVYSLGVIVLETLTGGVRLTGRAFHERMDAMRSERFSFSGVTETQRAVGAILARCLAIERESRFTTVAELSAAILPPLAVCEPFLDPLKEKHAVAGGDTMTLGE